MKLAELKPGDVCTYWVEVRRGIGHHGEAGMCYAKVLKVGKKFVTLKGERGEIARRDPHFLSRKLGPSEWRPECLDNP